MYGVCVPVTGHAGGLGLILSNEVLVQLRSFSPNHVDVDVSSENSVTNWRFTGFYGEPNATRRKSVLNRMPHGYVHETTTKCCFNTKKLGWERPFWQMEDFRRTLE
ncbi:UNVERIFIED_CONTAM: hypothetical protein Scaly_2962400 [Sesamum calycinum]|uniref:Uncharacterized protein n=1 Tax=Sesamum calycinum TaxID=2727403 RepID=A0AAW2KNM1_9LAMI